MNATKEFRRKESGKLSFTKRLWVKDVEAVSQIVSKDTSLVELLEQWISTLLPGGYSCHISVTLLLCKQWSTMMPVFFTFLMVQDSATQHSSEVLAECKELASKFSNMGSDSDVKNCQASATWHTHSDLASLSAKSCAVSIMHQIATALLMIRQRCETALLSLDPRFSKVWREDVGQLAFDLEVARITMPALHGDPVRENGWKPQPDTAVSSEEPVSRKSPDELLPMPLVAEDDHVSDELYELDPQTRLFSCPTTTDASEIDGKQVEPISTAKVTSVMSYNSRHLDKNNKENFNSKSVRKVEKPSAIDAIEGRAWATAPVSAICCDQKSAFAMESTLMSIESKIQELTFGSPSDLDIDDGETSMKLAFRKTDRDLEDCGSENEMAQDQDLSGDDEKWQGSGCGDAMVSMSDILHMTSSHCDEQMEFCNPKEDKFSLCQQASDFEKRRKIKPRNASRSTLQGNPFVLMGCEKRDSVKSTANKRTGVVAEPSENQPISASECYATRKLPRTKSYHSNLNSDSIRIKIAIFHNGIGHFTCRIWSDDEDWKRTKETYQQDGHKSVTVEPTILVGGQSEYLSIRLLARESQEYYKIDNKTHRSIQIADVIKTGYLNEYFVMAPSPEELVGEEDQIGKFVRFTFSVQVGENMIKSIPISLRCSKDVDEELEQLKEKAGSAKGGVHVVYNEDKSKVYGTKMKGNSQYHETNNQSTSNVSGKPSVKRP